MESSGRTVSAVVFRPRPGKAGATKGGEMAVVESVVSGKAVSSTVVLGNVLVVEESASSGQFGAAGCSRLGGYRRTLPIGPRAPP